VEMGAIFGRDRVVNIAIGEGQVSGRLFAIIEKLAGFRPDALVYRGVEPAPDRSARQHGGIGSR